jgi:hypothetical protein
MFVPIRRIEERETTESIGRLRLLALGLSAVREVGMVEPALPIRGVSLP